MKLKTKLLYFIGIIALGYGCGQQHGKISRTTRTVISGKIRNLEVYPDTKEFFVQITDSRLQKTVVKDSIKSDGTFKLVFDLYITQDIKLEPLVGRMFAHPGDSIQLDIDYKDIGNVRFSGDAQKSNQELHKFLNSNYSVNEFTNSEALKFTPDSYRLFCDSVKKLMFKKRDVFIKEKNPTAEILKWTEDYVNIHYFSSLLLFPFTYNKINNNEIFTTSEYYNFSDSLSTTCNSTLINTDVYELLGLYSATITKRFHSERSLPRDSTLSVIMEEISRTEKSSVFKQMLIGTMFYYTFYVGNIEYFEKNRELFDSHIQEDFIRVPLLNYYSSSKRDIENPQIASDATLKRMDNTLGKDIIDSILTENKGKVIYIDCWATWCGPCKEELPNSKVLMQKLEGKDIEFVFICLNSTKEQWIKNLEELQIGGSHIYCNSEQSLSVGGGFGIKGIPYYILINKKGQVIKSGNNLRPLFPGTIKIIEKLLNEV